jgi:sec1 family domain-containing protein 1
VAAQLDARLRDSLRSRTNVFTEAASASGGGAGGGASSSSSLQRPLLCIFDRNFELSVALQHAWTYKPLVHDLLGLKLGRVTVDQGGSASIGASGKKAYDVDDGDFFWAAHGREQFPRIAEQVENELAAYKAAVEELNRRAGAEGGANGGSGAVAASGLDPDEAMRANTRGLMTAVSSLPELTERKRTLDKHTNLATALLQEIKTRQVDKLYIAEEDLVAGKGDLAGTLRALDAPAGIPADKLRLALVWLLTSQTPPSDSDCQAVEARLTAAGADLAAWTYARRMRRMNLVGRQQQGGGGGAAETGMAQAQAQLTSLLGSTFGQGLSSLTKGVKNLLAGEQQAAVTVAVEALMDGRAGPEADGYACFDPKGPAGGAAPRPSAPAREAIVFVVGGGNYLEYESLATWASRAQPVPRSVVYGATEVLTGEEFLGQLAELGRRSGVQ